MRASRRRPRRGSALIPVLVCFVLIVLICGGLLKIGFAERDQVRAEESALQTEWLLESGVERAAAKLSAAPEYAGETWSLSADELNGPRSGSVTIVVEKDRAKVQSRKVTVVADYPHNSDRRNRQRKVVTVDVDRPGPETSQ